MNSTYEAIKKANPFDQQERKLVNIFVVNPPNLDAEQREDLLAVEQFGKPRMATYVRQYILEPPSETWKKEN